MKCFFHTNQLKDSEFSGDNANNDLYIHWDAHAPTTWKRGTIRTLLRRAHNVCSTQEYLSEEIGHLRKSFITINGFPKWFVNQVVEDYNHDYIRPVTEPPVEVKPSMIMVPYKGKVGEQLMKSLSKEVNSILPKEHEMRVVYTATKLGSCFQIKDETALHHRFDLVYEAKCPDSNCNASYVGEVGRRFIRRIHDHAGKDKKSHVLKHSIKRGHNNVDIADFRILAHGFRSNRFKRRISEALFIKQLKPSINSQEKSVPLKLFN